MFAAAKYIYGVSPKPNVMLKIMKCCMTQFMKRVKGCHVGSSIAFVVVKGKEY